MLPGINMFLGRNMIEFTQKELALLLFIMQDFWNKDIDKIKTRDTILERLRKEVKYD